MLSIVFQDKKTSEEFYGIYYSLLNDLPDIVIIESVKDCLKECRFFPTISEIRDRSEKHLKILEYKNNLDQTKNKKNIEEKKENSEKLNQLNYLKIRIRGLEDKKTYGKASREEIELLQRLREQSAEINQTFS